MPLETLVDGADGLVIRCLRNVGPYSNNIFLVADATSGAGYVIDAGYEPDQAAEAARPLTVRGILVTHGHRDHHEHVADFKTLLGNPPVSIGIDDAADLSIQPDGLVVDGQHLAFGAHNLQAIHTPGHTPGSTCFLVGNHLFTGDTLFPGGPGNTQKDPVRFERIMRSLRERLFSLPDDTIVYPGHGRDTTLGDERPHLDEWAARGWQPLHSPPDAGVSGLFDLSGRVALVTGASRGIGRAVAQGLAEAGAHVALASRSRTDLEACADAVVATGGQATVFDADLSRVGAVPQLVAEVLARTGQIDVLVNAAGMNRRMSSLDVTEADWDAVLTVNLKSVFFAAQCVGRYWVETRRFASEQQRGKGKIVNVASLTSSLGISRVAAYSASKSGLLGVTRTLAVEWAPHGICVNALTPGYIETTLTEPLFEDPSYRAWIESRIPQGVRGFPADMVGAAVFLCAPASDYVTGHSLAVDGGWLAG